ncbi:hypothetical protein CEE69_05220 [Rhodopirellula bahusiensis]|uniref:Uncharacterized protein n=1 Tax=Rhodopirellula bahusiensis TaxID=2014065 RepID=A0A2G1WCL6_9BACT|nr:hypothetical protein CEE69_05220 [Rhodopirellula bahusiensis]
MVWSKCNRLFANGDEVTENRQVNSAIGMLIAETVGSVFARRYVMSRDGKRRELVGAVTEVEVKLLADLIQKHTLANALETDIANGKIVRDTLFDHATNDCPAIASDLIKTTPSVLPL